MARKSSSSGPPQNRTEEEPWRPSDPHDAANRSLDLAVDVEIEEYEFEFVYGDIVHDEKADDPDDLIVVNTPSKTADEWQYDEETLADRNPDCPPDDDVIICVRPAVLENYLPDWDEREEDIPLDKLRNSEVPYLVFPSVRLLLVQESHLRK